MFTITWRWWRRLAIIWLLIISLLFLLPGSALPKHGWLNNIHLDKWVHFGFFAALIFLWRFYFGEKSQYNWLIIFFAFCYGLAVEMVQHHFIANRSFDVGDLIADMAGSLAGLWFWTRSYIKK